MVQIQRKWLYRRNKKPITKAIRNAGEVLILSILPLNKNSSKLKINPFKIPHYA